MKIPVFHYTGFTIMINILPNVNIFDWSKLKAFADDKTEICLGMGRKHCRKRRKCWLPARSPFPTIFSKGFFFRVVKSKDCVVESTLQQIQSFKDHEDETFGKHDGEIRKNFGYQHFLIFLHTVLCAVVSGFIIGVACNLSSFKALNVNSCNCCGICRRQCRYEFNTVF